jgi:cytochrome c oxidase cbb3-type subunit 1
METSLTYDDKVVRQFTIATIVWGIVGMLVGAIIAAQLAWPALNFNIAWFSYGRLRPLHANAVIAGHRSFHACANWCHVGIVAKQRMNTDENWRVH